MDEIDENHHSTLKQEYITLKRNLYTKLFKVTIFLWFSYSKPTPIGHDDWISNPVID